MHTSEGHRRTLHVLLSSFVALGPTRQCRIGPLVRSDQKSAIPPLQKPSCRRVRLCARRTTDGKWHGTRTGVALSWGTSERVVGTMTMLESMDTTTGYHPLAAKATTWAPGTTSSASAHRRRHGEAQTYLHFGFRDAFATPPSMPSLMPSLLRYGGVPIQWWECSVDLVSED